MNFYKSNIEKLQKKINEKEAVVFFSGSAPTKRGDEKYLFAPDRNFYYLTGIDRENIVLIIEKNKETLFVPKHDPVLAKWDGANLSVEQCKSISGIENVKFIEEFNDELEKTEFRKVYFDETSIDLKNNNYVNLIKNKYEKTDDISPVMTKLRLIKTDEEISRMEKAIEITRKGIEAVMKNIKPEMWEYEAEAYLDFTFRKNGVRDYAFRTIAASGVRGTILHYKTNNNKTKDGDLLLLDCGAQVDYYNGDLTRTFPVNGKYTEKQKLVYNIVLAGQKLVMENIKPGISIIELNEILKDFYFEELKKIGLIETKEEVLKYYYHNVGHFLGALTHDVGDRVIPLEENMIFTVEPGLYIEEWEIGIRTEDNVVVTKDGCRNLSSKMIKTVEEIESFMLKDA